MATTPKKKDPIAAERRRLKAAWDRLNDRMQREDINKKNQAAAIARLEARERALKLAVKERADRIAAQKAQEPSGPRLPPPTQPKKTTTTTTTTTAPAVQGDTATGVEYPGAAPLAPPTKGGITLKPLFDSTRRDPEATDYHDVGALKQRLHIAYAANELGIPFEDVTEAQLGDWKKENDKPKNIKQKNAITQQVKDLRRAVLTESAANETVIGRGTADKPGGISTDYFTTGGIDIDLDAWALNPEEASIRNRYLYYIGDADAAAFQDYTGEEILSIQKGLAGIGYLTGKYPAGQWDPKTTDAMTKLMTAANANGTTWEAFLDSSPVDISDGPGPGGGGSGSKGPLALYDPESIRQAVDKVGSEGIGKNVDPGTREAIMQEILQEAGEAEARGEQYDAEDRIRAKVKGKLPGQSAENDALSVFNSFARMMGSGGLYGQQGGNQPITNSPATGAPGV